MSKSSKSKLALLMALTHMFDSEYGMPKKPKKEWKSSTAGRINGIPADEWHKQQKGGIR